MPIARIYRPAKTAMSSGRGQTKSWLLEYETATPRRPDPLMGWISAGDTLNEVRVRFETLDEAKAFAASHGIDYVISEPNPRGFRPKAYADNFRFDKVPR